MTTDFFDYDDSTIDEVIPLSRDLRRASDTLQDDEARFLVDQYYIIQEMRKATDNQLNSMDDEPHDMLGHTRNNMWKMERQIVSVLDRYTSADHNQLSQWSKSLIGVGPILSAGLLAYIDIDKAKSPASIWRFAGYDPTATWNKGEKRPHNGSLKTLCWKIGESFVKVKGNPKDFYGHLYQERRDFEDAKNEAGEYAEEAAKQLQNKNYGKTTDAYKAYSQGKLPPNHLFARSKRWTVKLFLSHYWQVGKELKNDLPSDWKPWVISIWGHQDLAPVPNFPIQNEAPIFHPEDVKTKAA